MATLEVAFLQNQLEERKRGWKLRSRSTRKKLACLGYCAK